MASAPESTKRRLFRLSFPFLFKECPQGNFHWLRDRFCFCGLGTYSGNWHGGVWDFKQRAEIPTVHQIAEKFFEWLEKYYPLEQLWATQNIFNVEKHWKDYSYQHFKQDALRRLQTLIQKCYRPGMGLIQWSIPRGTEETRFD